MGKLENKVAVITGGNSGIGLATAEEFVAQGAHVFITGRRQKELDEAAAKIGRNVTAVQGDVSNLGDLDRLYAQVSGRRDGSTLCLQTRDLANLQRSATSPGNTTTRFST
jgi:NAD(P)-dependent dehydrogenase (short-subunit alcohol dehydrogenase family)